MSARIMLQSVEDPVEAVDITQAEGRAKVLLGAHLSEL